MVVSEILAATMIAVCGLKKSYRIVLRGERMVRRRIRRPERIVEGYQSFPRTFIRMVFRAGQTIAMRWEGRAQNAAQRARAARLRAEQARERVEDISADVRAKAEEVRAKAEEVRARAGDVSERVRGQVRKAQDRASSARKTAQSTVIVVRESAQNAKERFDAARKTAQSTVVVVRDTARSAKDRLDAARDTASGLAERARTTFPSTFGMGQSSFAKEQKGLAGILEDDNVRNEKDAGGAEAKEFKKKKPTIRKRL